MKSKVLNIGTRQSKFKKNFKIEPSIEKEENLHLTKGVDVC